MGSKEAVSLINSVIGEGAKFSGELQLDGLVRIDGDFVGTINCSDKVLVSKTGRVRSSIFARFVVIAGSVFGDVCASETLEILSTAFVVGNVRTPSLLVEEGVIFHGLCDVISLPIVEGVSEDSVIKSSSSFSIDWHSQNSFQGRRKVKNVKDGSKI